jgi:hypothetical protein
MVPLGYVSRDKKLFIEEEEAERVRTIFQGYLELGSIGLLLADLRERGIVTRRRHLSDGRIVMPASITHKRDSEPLDHFIRASAASMLGPVGSPGALGEVLQ